MIEIRSYKPEDYMKIQRKKFDLYTFNKFPHPEQVAIQLSNGLAVTALEEDKIICCGGILPLWKDVGEAWLVASELVQNHKILFFKKSLGMLESMIRLLSLNRVQTTVDAEYESSIRWLECLGFEFEGVMRKYIAGRTYLRYAKIMGD